MAPLLDRCVDLPVRVVAAGQTLITEGVPLDELYVLETGSFDVLRHGSLIADVRDPGVEVRPLITNTGGAHFHEVFFSNVRIARANVIGEIDGGWTVARTTLANESVMIGTSSAGARDVDQLATLGAVDDDRSVVGERRHLGEAGPDARLVARHPPVGPPHVAIVSVRRSARQTVPGVSGRVVRGAARRAGGWRRRR